MNPLTLSIVIPSHCRADLLEFCLRSVVRCRPAHTEIIVVDDGSRESLISRTAQQFPSVNVVRNLKPQGFAAAANAGIARATGDIVELLNDDAEVTAGWAEAALKPFTEPRIVAVAPLVVIHSGDDDTPVLVSQ